LKGSANWGFNPNGESLSVPKIANVGNDINFTFDQVCDSEVTQEKMYQHVAYETVKKLMEGYNGTIFAYGQSGSGKTYTMLGPDEVVTAIKSGEKIIPHEIRMMYGVIPRAITHMFELINRILETQKCEI
jgi:kinesin family member 15